LVGSSGFLGSRLASALSDLKLTRVTLASASPIDKVINENDFLAIESFSKEDILIFAGNVYNRKLSQDLVSNLFDYNLKKQLACAFYFLAKGGGRLVTFRSFLELLEKPINVSLDLYRKSKVAFHESICLLDGYYDFDWLSITLYDNFGLNDPRGKFVSEIRARLINQKEMMVLAPNTMIDVMSVNQQVDCIVSSLKDGVTGEYSLASFCPISLLEILEIMEIVNGKGALKYNLGNDMSTSYICYGQPLPGCVGIDSKKSLRDFFDLSLF